MTESNGQEFTEQVFEDQGFSEAEVDDGDRMTPEEVIAWLEESGVLEAGGLVPAGSTNLTDPMGRAEAYSQLLTSRALVGTWMEEALKDYHTRTGVAAFEKMRLQRAIDRTHLEVDDDGRPRINGKNAEIRRAQLREALELEYGNSERADQRVLTARRELEIAQARLRTTQDTIKITELIDRAVRDAAAAQEADGEQGQDSANS